MKTLYGENLPLAKILLVIHPLSIKAQRLFFCLSLQMKDLFKCRLGIDNNQLHVTPFCFIYHINRM